MLLNSLQGTGQLRQQRTILTKTPTTQNDQIRTHTTQTFLTHIPSLHPHFQVYMNLHPKLARKPSFLTSSLSCSSHLTPLSKLIHVGSPLHFYAANAICLNYCTAFKSYFFSAQPVGSEFPDQGSNPSLLQWKL